MLSVNGKRSFIRKDFGLFKKGDLKLNGYKKKSKGMYWGEECSHRVGGGEIMKKSNCRDD